MTPEAAQGTRRLRVGCFLGTDGDYGGAGRILWNVLRHADRIGIEPVAVLSRRGPGVAELEARGIPWTVWPKEDQGVAAAAFRAVRIRGLVREHDLDLVHCLSGAFGWRAWELRALRRAGCPVLVHTQRPIPAASPYLRHTDAVAACSAYLAGELRCDAPVHAVHDLVDAERMQAGRSLRAELGIPPETRVVAFVGRPRTAKGIGLFLEVAASGLLPDTRFLLSVQRGNRLPDTWDEETLRARIAAAPQVELLGHVARIEDVYATADALLLPFLGEEPCPAVLEEAAVAGVPVVTSRGGSVREYVEEGLSGLYVASPSVQNLAEALARVLEGRPAADRRGGIAAWGRERFLERPIRTLRAIYRALGGGADRTAEAC
ncbi:glycosyltransferase family 4 protein [Inmirania thermothiophila]|uniref:Glycosyltransferase involved in cell wall biosynthesis n=1 Tax=Inmirania thermothiophila TaxID=1750597 RepID=A0A3N1XWR5_9GAMM|nr:glycosyltransferase family 4 protein [Inmirania thermothiophila]ROR29632.1 glycosyltransferase involved in cell wall biosynthesis [Inmirania thermothiophila]